MDHFSILITLHFSIFISVSSNFVYFIQHRLQSLLHLQQYYQIVCVDYGIDLSTSRYVVYNVLECFVDELLSVTCSTLGTIGI